MIQPPPAFDANRLSLWRFIAGAFIVFSLGYVLFFGTAAKASGSWKYIIHQIDEYGYWAYSKGASETPNSEGNPFYYEAMGTRQTVPYTTATLIGWAAKLLGVSVLFFFPVFHIGMPLLNWLVLFLCLYKIWGYPLRPSAVISGILLLSLLFLRGVTYDIVLRYSRPGDGIWALIVWISYAMNGKPKTSLTKALLGFSVLACIWINPFLAVAGAAITFFEFLWQALVSRNRARVYDLGILLGITVLSSLLYIGFIWMNMNQNIWALTYVKNAMNNYMNYIEWPSLALYAIILIMALVHQKFSKSQTTKLDRLVIFLFVLEPLFGNIQILLSSNLQFGPKRYYFTLLEMACLVAWFIEKISSWLHSDKLRKKEFWIVGGVILIEIWILTNNWFNPFRYGFIEEREYVMENNSRLLLTLCPSIALVVWAYLRIPLIGMIFRNRFFIILTILAMTLSGFGGIARYFYPPGAAHHPFPFDQAYQWLNKNASRNEVVLTVPPSELRIDFLPLYTNLKTYINPLGDTLSGGPKYPENHLRFNFYYHLLIASLDGYKLPGATTLKEKLTCLKLDYILIKIPSPFLSNITRQLGDHIREVYRDPHALIFKVQ
ncbi:MAG: hypothetical protein PHN49_03485 [Candidatus Omnitrophica bacterium]|nr:hypothetical protein [Candidatus Omnitrophota bacterium]